MTKGAKYGKKYLGNLLTRARLCGIIPAADTADFSKFLRKKAVKSFGFMGCKSLTENPAALENTSFSPLV